MSEKRNHKLGSIPVIKLLGRLTLYYAAIFGLLFIAVKLIPGLNDFLPFGGGASLAEYEQTNSFTTSSATIFSNLSADYKENGLRMLCAILGVIQVMLPVTWVYLRSRVKSGLDQSLVQTMLLLPVIVAGVVIIVQTASPWPFPWLEL